MTRSLCDRDQLKAYALSQAALNESTRGSFGTGTWVLFGANVCLVLLASYTVLLRVRHGKGFKLFRVVDGLLEPNAPLMASLSLGAYGALVVVFLMLFNRFLEGKGTVGLVLTLFGLLPTTMFGWAWWHAIGTLAHFHRVADDSNGQRWALWNKRVFNVVQVVVPVTVVAVSSITLPMLMGRRTSQTSAYSKAAFHLTHQSPAATESELDAAWSLAERSCRHANELYRALWGSWCGVFLFTLLLYTLYSCLLGHALCRKLHAFQPAPIVQAPGAAWEHKVSLGGARGVGRETGLGMKRTATFTDAMAQRKKNAEALADLRTTLLLSKWELAGFAAFCLSWAALSLYRIVEGLGLITNLVAWGRLWRASVAIATSCAAVVLICIVMRTRVLASAQKRSSSHLSGSISSFHKPTHTRNLSGKGSIQVMVETFCEVTCDQPFHTTDCSHASPHLPHLHEPALPATPIRVRFPTLGEEHEEDEDDKPRKASIARTSISEPGWIAPTGWESPPTMAAIGSPLVIPHDGEVDEIPLNFVPLRRISDLDLGLRERSPSIDERK